MDKKYEISKESLIYGGMIIEIYKYLTRKEKEYVISNQLLRSGTSIGANIMEAQEGQSKKDFLHKMSISLKEARESEYWIKLLDVGGYLQEYEKSEEIIKKTHELISVLTKIVKTTRINLGN